MNSEHAIQVQDLHKDFGEVYAVKGVSFDVQKGEIFSLLGPNGAGKSTTISMIACLLEPNEGDVQVIIFSLVAMFVLAGLGGAWVPLEFTGEAVQTIGHLLPSAWAMDGFENIVIRGLGLESAWLPVGIMAAYAVGLFALAVWRFRFE